MSPKLNTQGTVSLTRKELATRWNMHPVTIKRWEKSGRLKPLRLGPRIVRYPLDYVHELEAE